jgi:hypothetical protein
MVHPEVTIHPHVGHSDGCPSRASQLSSGEVKGGDIVGIVLKTALHTPEEGLASPVSLIDPSASWAGYGSVLRLDIDDWYSPFESLIFDKRLEPSESPAVEVPILIFSVLDVHPDSSELLHYNYVAFPERVHKRPADLVQDRIDLPPLPSAQPFQGSFGAFRALALEGGAELSKTVPFGEDFSALGFEAVGSHEKVSHPNVYANRIASFRLWNLLFNRNVEEEGSVSVDQDGVGRSSILEKLSLVVSYI